MYRNTQKYILLSIMKLKRYAVIHKSILKNYNDKNYLKMKFVLKKTLFRCYDLNPCKKKIFSKTIILFE